MDLLNVTTYSTSASTTKVLVLDGTTIKSRTAAQVITDGGGTSATGRNYECVLCGASTNGTNPHDIIVTKQTVSGVTSGGDGWGWPWDTYYHTVLATSLAQAAKFVVNFNPTTWRISAVNVYAPTYGSASPNGGNFGLRLQYSVDGSTNWTDVGTLSFYGTSAGQFLTATGSLTVTGYTSLVYFRIVQSYSLTTGGSAIECAATATVRNLIVSLSN